MDSPCIPTQDRRIMNVNCGDYNSYVAECLVSLSIEWPCTFGELIKTALVKIRTRARRLPPMIMEINEACVVEIDLPTVETVSKSADAPNSSVQSQQIQQAQRTSMDMSCCEMYNHVDNHDAIMLPVSSPGILYRNDHNSDACKALPPVGPVWRMMTSRLVPRYLMCDPQEHCVANTVRLTGLIHSSLRAVLDAIAPLILVCMEYVGPPQKVHNLAIDRYRRARHDTQRFVMESARLSCSQKSVLWWRDHHITRNSNTRISHPLTVSRRAPSNGPAKSTRTCDQCGCEIICGIDFYTCRWCPHLDFCSDCVRYPLSDSERRAMEQHVDSRE